MILVTRGAHGAAYYDRESSAEHAGFKVQVADTVGSGDSFLAMFISKALNGIDPEECIKYACAMGAAVASQNGATPDIDLDQEIKKLMN